jgi:alpha-galactosidase
VTSEGTLQTGAQRLPFDTVPNDVSKDLIHLTAAGVSVIVDTSFGAPVILHWGEALSANTSLASLRNAMARPILHGDMDVVAPIAVVPEHGSAFAGRPGLGGHWPDGSAWAPRFQPAHVEHDGQTLRVVATDRVAQLTLTCDLTLESNGILLARNQVTNNGTESYQLEDLSFTLPLPAQAEELLTFPGRWCRELHPTRVPFETGALLQENRRGRTSHDHIPLLFAGTKNFGEWTGETWGVHLAWSGNNTMLAEVMADGRRYLQLGELLHPGEVELEPGESYETPEIVATYGVGLTKASQRLHRYVRSRPNHPPLSKPRPVLLNTWEAVYFNHDTEVLKGLAEAAAAVGAERFVLDDGWFGSRRNDQMGLGDWWVSPQMYANGLNPLIDHVRSLGMEFGIWVEPEMVNPDSDLFRAHPDWALTTPGYPQVYGRQQLVLNIAHREAYAYILGQLDALLRDHDIAYVKWDMNRDHVQGSGRDGRAGSSAQTVALYALLDELAVRHPNVEIESCASGGGRIDLEILKRTSRVWTSDCNDALERQTIQRGAAMLLPPELMGAHIGPVHSHTTARNHSLAFRSITALFGHLGVEWNLLTLSDSERADLATVIALHKRFRPLLHGGDVVRFDVPGGATQAHGVYAADQTEALVAFIQLRTAPSLTPPPLRLPGLSADATYRVEAILLPGQERLGPGRRQPAWLADGIVLTGAQLAVHGLQMPSLDPENGLLLHLTRV